MGQRYFLVLPSLDAKQPKLKEKRNVLDTRCVGFASAYNRQMVIDTDYHQDKRLFQQLFLCPGLSIISYSCCY